MHQKQFLEYSKDRWQEVSVSEENTLQLFITNKCNLRCKGCFYADNLGTGEMSFDVYKSHILKYKCSVKKVTLLGGEPTLHSLLPQMISFNQSFGLKTTVYTNGFHLEKLEGISLEGVKIRVGVHGTYSSEKPLVNVRKTVLPVTIVYMLRRDNVAELMDAVKLAEQNFNCDDFFVSSIRDIASTGNYWLDNADTIPMDEYFEIVQKFVSDYKGRLNIHISKRGVIKSKFDNAVDRCRFGNVFPDGTKIRCPLDISLNKQCSELEFNKIKCNKDACCILRKMVLKRINFV